MIGHSLDQHAPLRGSAVAGLTAPPPFSDPTGARAKATRRTPFPRTRAWLYDTAITPMTTGWYRAVLARLPRGCRLLDVGIGTGTALLANADLVLGRALDVTGVDVNPAYVQHCRAAVRARRLAGKIHVRLESILDHRGGPYDAAYFSGSFMLLADPAAALRHVASLLAPGGRMYFTQTFERRRSRALEAAKPLIRLLTTVDFGRVTYEADFRRMLSATGMVLDEVALLNASARRVRVLAVAHVDAA